MIENLILSENIGVNRMLSEIIELFNFIKNMNEDLKNNKKESFHTYIDDVYQMANVVLKEYLDIFSTIKTNVSEKNWNANDILLYIEKVEYKHKDMRIYLRTLKCTRIPLNCICQDDYETFLTSIIQLLTCHTGLSDTHTLLGFADLCRRYSSCNIDEQREKILMLTNSTLKGLEMIWEKICIYYNKIKSDFN